MSLFADYQSFIRMYSSNTLTIGAKNCIAFRSRLDLNLTGIKGLV